MIEAHNLSKSFGTTHAVKDVSFTVERGDVVGLLGPNGAGKSTTMKMLSGALLPDHGSGKIDGHDIVGRRTDAQQALGYMPEAAGGFPDLTVREFLTFCADARQFSAREADKAIEDIAESTLLSPALDKTFRTLSKGWRQRAWFAQAVLHGPSALILDEPTDGLDPGQKDHIRDYIRKISEHTAIILSTHILQEAEELCTRVIIIADGTVVKDSPIGTLLDETGRLGQTFAELTAASRKAVS